MDRYCDIEGMCRPQGSAGRYPPRGCPYDGLGCTGESKCSINSDDAKVRAKAWVADRYGTDLVCAKWLHHMQEGALDG